MQIEQKDDSIEESITYEDTIVNVDVALGKLRHHHEGEGRNFINNNPWPETAYCFRERSVVSNQLWLHNIQHWSIEETTRQIANTRQHQQRTENNNDQILIQYCWDLKLTCISNCTISWVHNKAIQYKQLLIIDYIKYLSPLAIATSQSIISTVVARAKGNTQHILNSEIVSIGEFRSFHNNQSDHWHYLKETKESYRNRQFRFFHTYDIYKSVNYQVRQRIVINLNKYLHLEIILVKQNYFNEIVQYYSQYNQSIINLSNTPISQFEQPHQIARFDSLDHIVTEYYQQS